jgi:8-amino-7-oxononanoate synthase
MIDFESKIREIKRKDLLRFTKNFSNMDSPRAELDGKEILIFGSNDYLGLANDERLKVAAINEVYNDTIGSTGSRLTSGSRTVFSELERVISEVKGTEASLIFNSGYMANLGVLSAICDREFDVFSDKYNHASIVDGIILSRAKIIRYKHCCMDSLEKRLKISNSKKKLIVTDGVFSMDGDIAPLRDIRFLSKKYNAMVMVDDAHGFGVLGKCGSGTCSYLGIDDGIDIQIGTLSKAVGCVGGYASGSRQMIEYLKNISRSFVFSTSLPPSMIRASIESINIIKTESERQQKLMMLADYMREKLINLGMDFGQSTITPIIPIMIGDENKAVSISKRLMDEYKIYMPAIRVPTVPKGKARLRASLTANHNIEDIDYVINSIADIWGSEIV